MVKFFLLLQFLDLMTTLAGLKLGLVEISPSVRWLMKLNGPAAGILITKLLAVVLLGVCLWSGRRKVIGWVNCWYCALVTWNWCFLFFAVGRAISGP